MSNNLFVETRNGVKSGRSPPTGAALLLKTINVRVFHKSVSVFITPLGSGPTVSSSGSPEPEQVKGLTKSFGLAFHPGKTGQDLAILPYRDEISFNRSAGAWPPRTLDLGEKRPQPKNHGRLLLRPMHGEGQALAYVPRKARFFSS